MSTRLSMWKFLCFYFFFLLVVVDRARSTTISVNSSAPLGIDEAWIDLVVDDQNIGELTVSILNVRCVSCPYEKISQNLSVQQSMRIIVETNFDYRLRIEGSTGAFCLQTLSLGEHGEYTMNIRLSSTADPSLECSIVVQRQPNRIYIPLIVGGVILLVLFVGCIVSDRLKLVPYLTQRKDRLFQRISPTAAAPSYDLQACQPIVTAGLATDGSATIKPLPAKSKRLASLDAFRGFTLIAMIFVNYGGGGYAAFEHGPWHGLTFADIVFPFFVWMLGTSLVMSLKNSAEKNLSKRSILIKTFTRTLKLFIIGFILNTRSRVFLADARVLGVLQRFAIVYGVVATIEVVCLRSKQYVLPIQTEIIDQVPRPTIEKRLRNVFSDILNFPYQWLLNLIVVLIWLLIVYLVPFENCPAGYLGPGGLADNGKYQNCTGGITGYIDRLIITERHLYTGPTCKSVYECRTFDPENLFGALPTMFLAYLGIQAGRILVMYPTHRERLIRLFLWSILTLALGIGLSGGTLDAGPMPLNKNLWTLSFSFFTAGLASVGFTLMYILIDMLRWWDGTPFQYPGMNSILIYVLHSALASYFPVQWAVANTHAARLAMTLWGCIFWILMSYIFYRKKFFLVL